MAYSMGSKDVRRMRRILLELLDRSEADACVVCDQAGHVLAEEGLESQDPHLMSALGAGVFAATRELAGLLGENEFSSVVHQGTRRSILICAVDEQSLLLVIFGTSANLGLVKLYASPAAMAMRAVLDRVRGRSEEETAPPGHTFVLRQGAPLFGAGK